MLIINNLIMLGCGPIDFNRLIYLNAVAGIPYELD